MIEILSETKTEHGLHLRLRTESGVTGTVSVTSWEVRVLKETASHQVWRGSGRGFKTFDEALAGYKSADMKSLIQFAKDRADA